MTNTSITTLSRKRILITLAIFICTPLLAHLINIAVVQYDLSLMFSLNLGAAVMIMYNWNLFGIHYNRAKYNFIDTCIYSFIAFVLFTLWTYISNRYLKCIVIMPRTEVLVRYGYARIGMLIAYSFSEASMLCIVGKCATDPLTIHHRELQIILLSGISIGLLTTILFLPSKNLLTILITLLYNVVLCTILSYLYNQSNSFIPGLMGFSGSNLFFMIASLL